MIRRNSYGDFSSESLCEYFTYDKKPSMYSEDLNQKETLQCIALSLEAIAMILNDALQSKR